MVFTEWVSLNLHVFIMSIRRQSALSLFFFSLSLSRATRHAPAPLELGLLTRLSRFSPLRFSVYCRTISVKRCHAGMWDSAKPNGTAMKINSDPQMVTR